MKREFTASRLLRGTAQVCARAAWWPRHSHVTLHRFEAVTKGKPSLRKEYDKTLIALATEWDNLIGDRVNHTVFLMGEHTEIERRLMETALEGDSDGFRLANQHLQQNARNQSDLLSAAIPDFPICSFGQALHDHNDSFVRFIAAHFDRDPKTAKQCRDINAWASLSLSRVAAEWLS